MLLIMGYQKKNVTNHSSLILDITVGLSSHSRTKYITVGPFNRNHDRTLPNTCICLVYNSFDTGMIQF